MIIYEVHLTKHYSKDRYEKVKAKVMMHFNVCVFTSMF